MQLCDRESVSPILQRLYAYKQFKYDIYFMPVRQVVDFGTNKAIHNETSNMTIVEPRGLTHNCCLTRFEIMVLKF